MTKNQILALVLLLVIIFLGATIEFAGFIGFLLLTPLSLLLFVVLAAELISKHLKLFSFKNIRKIILSFWCAAVILILSAGFLTPAPPAVDTSGDTSQQLKYAYETDQFDRNTSKWLFYPQRDQERLALTLELIKRQELAPEDAYHAAYILQHGTCQDHFLEAYDLAYIASEAGIEKAHQLKLQAQDRYLLASGQQQMHGTQFQPLPIVRECEGF